MLEVANADEIYGYLLEQARQKDGLTYDDILAHVPDAEKNIALLDEIMEKLMDAGIEVTDTIQNVDEEIIDMDVDADDEQLDLSDELTNNDEVMVGELEEEEEEEGYGEQNWHDDLTGDDDTVIRQGLDQRSQKHRIPQL